MTGAQPEQDRRAATAADVAALRAEMAAGFSRTDAANARMERRLDAVESSMKPYSEHIATAAVLGEVHTATYAEVVKRQDKADKADERRDERLTELEGWRIEMRTLGVILKATFGVSLVGAILALASLAEMVGRLGH